MKYRVAGTGEHGVADGRASTRRALGGRKRATRFLPEKYDGENECGHSRLKHARGPDPGPPWDADDTDCGRRRNSARPRRPVRRPRAPVPARPATQNLLRPRGQALPAGKCDHEVSAMAVTGARMLSSSASSDCGNVSAIPGCNRIHDHQEHRHLPLARLETVAGTEDDVVRLIASSSIGSGAPTRHRPTPVWRGRTASRRSHQ
jgi:hypothetical protein